MAAPGAISDLVMGALSDAALMSSCHVPVSTQHEVSLLLDRPTQ